MTHRLLLDVSCCHSCTSACLPQIGAAAGQQADRADIAGLLAFYKDKVDLYLDGERQ